MIDWSGIELPFSVTDLLNSATGLLGLLGPFLLLAMAFVFVRILIYYIKMAMDTRNDNRLNADKPRDQYSFWEAAKQDLLEDKLYKFRRRS